MDEMAKCMSCGRYTWSARSRKAGRGSGCQAKVRTAVRLALQAPGFSPAQMAKAAELIELGAIVPGAFPGMYRAVSSDGTTWYLTSADGCSCPATAACYHRFAAAILDAA
jgi:hypothetical protein